MCLQLTFRPIREGPRNPGPLSCISLSETGPRWTDTCQRTPNLAYPPCLKRKEVQLLCDAAQSLMWAVCDVKPSA